MTNGTECDLRREVIEKTKEGDCDKEWSGVLERKE